MEFGCLEMGFERKLDLVLYLGLPLVLVESKTDGRSTLSHVNL